MAEEKIKSWIPVFRKELNLDEKFENAYERILQIDRNNIDTKHSSYPAGIAYIACLWSNQKRTQEHIAKVARCSKTALYKRYKNIKERNKLELPDDF